MASTLTQTKLETLEDLIRELGDIPLTRILVKPPLGTATVNDVIAAAERPQKMLCELIEGTLVEKDMGALESFLAGILLQLINNYLQQEERGIAFGPDGPFRILPNQVRLPDVSVFDWESVPDQIVPTDKVPELVPDLAIEIISEGNTKKEMERKLRDYFAAGVKLVWYIYPKTQSAEVYTAPTKRKKVTAGQSLLGGDLLPGFELPLKKLFERVAKSHKKK